MRRLVLFVTIFLLFAGTGYSQQSAQEFSDKVGQTTDSLYTLASAWVSQFLNETYGEKHFKALKPLRSQMERFLNAELKEYNKPNEVEGAESLRAAMVSLLTFEKQLVQEAFVPFEGLSGGASDNAMSTCGDRLKSQCNLEPNYLSKVSNERKAFAKKYNVQLEPVAAEKTERRKGPGPKIPHIIIQHPSPQAEPEQEAPAPPPQAPAARAKPTNPDRPERPETRTPQPKKIPQEPEDEDDKD